MKPKPFALFVLLLCTAFLHAADTPPKPIDRWLTSVGQGGIERREIERCSAAKLQHSNGRDSTGRASVLPNH